MKKYEPQFEAKENGVAKALQLIGTIIYFSGFIAGIAFGQVEVMGYYYTHTEFSWSLAFMWWIASAISGTMFLGFAEIINLLTAIKYKTYIVNEDDNISDLSTANNRTKIEELPEL